MSGQQGNHTPNVQNACMPAKMARRQDNLLQSVPHFGQDDLPACRGAYAELQKDARHVPSHQPL